MIAISLIIAPLALGPAVLIGLYLWRRHAAKKLPRHRCRDINCPDCDPEFLAEHDPHAALLDENVWRARRLDDQPLRGESAKFNKFVDYRPEDH